jgi:hypothetical protein
MGYESLSPAERIQKIAGLLGIAVLRWRRNQESSEILSDSQPERLEFGSDSLLSVNTQNDLADGAIETNSRNMQGIKNDGRRTATEDRCIDRRSNLATRS